MTISLERAVRAELPPAVPSGLVFGNEDHAGIVRGDDVQAVVSMQVALTRDALAAALDLAGCISDDPVDSWPVADIREAVEIQLHMTGSWQLLRDSRRFAEMVDDPTIGDAVRATYRAVDRAYPKTA